MDEYSVVTLSIHVDVGRCARTREGGDEPSEALS
jgi:hypothetical protein